MQLGDEGYNDNKMSDSDREFDSFPRLEFLPNPPLGTAALRDSQVIQIEFGYNFILLTQPKRSSNNH